MRLAWDCKHMRERGMKHGASRLDIATTSRRLGQDAKQGTSSEMRRSAKPLMNKRLEVVAPRNDMKHMIATEDDTHTMCDASVS